MFLTHSYHVKDEDAPVCIACYSLLTVDHILINCVGFDIVRQIFYTASNLRDLFCYIYLNE